MAKYRIKEQIRWDYIYEGKHYPVTIYKKTGMHNFRARYVSRDKGIVMTCSYLASERAMNAALTKMMPSLLKSSLIDGAESLDSGETYLFGERKVVPGLSSMTSKEKDNLWKKTLKKAIEPRVRMYEEKMGINPPYRVSVKIMSSRYGSNSKKTRTLAFSSMLVHYSYEIIDSVIIHELCHDKYRDHGSGFHKMLKKYDPKCEEHRHKLIKGIYA